MSVSKKITLSFFVLIFIASFGVASEWSSWRGPFQNGVSPEKNLISTWAVNGENLIWRADFIGRSTPIVMNGRVYVTGRTGEGITMQEHIACFDAKDGKKLWEKKYNVYHSTVPFTRLGWASPVGDPETGNIYIHGVGGLMICLDKDGKEVWVRSLGEEFGHLSGYGGRTDTPVVDGDLVILGYVNSSWGEHGAPRHRFYAFDKRTGEPVWISTPGEFPYDFNIYSTPVMADINGQRLLIGGNGDGAIYAMKVGTGEKVWGFKLSKRGVNSSVVVDGTKVFATHSEENMDSATMGRAVAIDATGTGDVTKTHELWRIDKLQAGYASPVIHNGRLYLVDNSANLFAINAENGQRIWNHNLGTVGKGSPVWADGKLYATEVNGTFLILQTGDEEAKELDREKLTVKGTRHAEIYGSPAIAYGRIYFTTEEGVYCLGNKDAAFQTSNDPYKKPALLTGDPASQITHVQIVPAEILLKPGETMQYRARGFNNKGQFVKEVKGMWTTKGVEGKFDASGKFTAGQGTHAGTVAFQANDMTASARMRIIPDLPLAEDFESIEPGKAPSHWIGAGRKFTVKEKDGGKVLAKPPMESGLQTAEVFFGPPDYSSYTIQADLMGTKTKRRIPDMGLLASGYALDLMGNHQRLQLRSWASELRVNKTIDFKWTPDTWYTMKLQVEMRGDKGIVRGKVWPKGQSEPKEWTVVAEDPVPVRQGSPGIYGNSTSEIYYDNIKVSKN